MYDHLYSYISSHGINDIYYPFYMWFPIYSFTISISFLIPLSILNIILFIGTIQHFSHDINLSFNQTLIISIPLLRYKDKKYIQNFILFYLCMIHLPYAYYNINLLFIHHSLIQYIPSLITYLIVYNNKSLIDIIEYMIYFPGKEYKNIYLQKLIIGIINSHTLLHFIVSNYYYNLNK